jgi:hypothetical protein
MPAWLQRLADAAARPEANIDWSAPTEPALWQFMSYPGTRLQRVVVVGGPGPP